MTTTNAVPARPDLLAAARDLERQVRQLSTAISAHAAEFAHSVATVDTSLAQLRRLIADDACAMTYQSFGQYRTMLLRAIDQAGTTTTSKETAE